MCFEKKVVIFLSFLLLTNFVYASKQKWCDMAKENRKMYLKFPDMVSYEPPTSNVMSPFARKAPIDDLTSGQIANMLSGYYCDSVNNHPLIYASSDGFIVTGVSFNKVYPLNRFNDAINAYKKLLISSGYTK